MPAAVTPSGVRDGDPAALAGMCAVRGPSVLAYCRHVAGNAAAADAAAEAFARFRTTVVQASDLADVNPEALLISATRSAAASRAERAPLGVCAVVPLLLAARADKTISPADGALVEQHLETCWACRAPVARFEAAERAYRDPPDRLMDPAVIASIIAAMAAAAPARGAEPAPAPATNANGTATPAAAAPVTAAEAPVHPAAVLEAEESRVARRTRERRAPRGAIGAHIPRARRTPKTQAAVFAGPAHVGAGARSRGSRRRSKLPLPIVLPVAVVFVAVLVALFVSGVFGGDDPASSPRVAAPADDVPARNAPADVVVVPGAKEASPDDIESAKARERARARREREAAAARTKPTDAPAVTPPAASAPDPVVAPPPPPPPPAARNEGSREVDAGNGATGAEQIPPAADSSTVPDLAPAPEPATAP